MKALNHIDSPLARGEATVRVIGENGEIKCEIVGKNIINVRFWDSLFFNAQNRSDRFNGSWSLYYPRVYISDDRSKPTPYQFTTTMIGQGTEHPAGDYTYGTEPVTQTPFIEIRNIFQVTGVERTFYSLGLFGQTAVPTNDLPSTSTSYAFTRLLLDAPVTQGVTDQLDVVYRIYFDSTPSSSFPGVGWAQYVDWSFTRTSSQYRGNIHNQDYVFGTGAKATPTAQRNSHFPAYASRGTSTHGVNDIVLGPGLFGNSMQQPWKRDYYANSFHNGTSFETSKDYMWGVAFNEWWAGGYDTHVRPDQPVAWLKDNQYPANSWLFNPGYTGSQRHYQIPWVYQDVSAVESPFKPSFNHSADSKLMTYDVNALPRTTYRISFGGSWPSDDKYPLFCRAWWSEGGAVDGATAKYKLAFCRTIGLSRGEAGRDEQIYSWGTGALGRASAAQATSYKTQNLGTWTRHDLVLGHVEFSGSRFGNGGIAEKHGSGSDTYNSHLLGTSDNFYGDQSEERNFWDCKKYPGLHFNEWWGYQTGKRGKTDFCGVEWRQMDPMQRQVWDRTDISPSLGQIDYMAPVRGLPGDVDDSMALVVDSTSGAYLINKTTDTVTTITTETGFVKGCSHLNVNGQLDHTLMKIDENGYPSLHDSLTGYAGSGETAQNRFWESLGSVRRPGPFAIGGGNSNQLFLDSSLNNWQNVAVSNRDSFVHSKLHHWRVNDTNRKEVIQNKVSPVFTSSSGTNIPYGAGLELSGDFTIEAWLYQTTRGSSDQTLYEFGRYNQGGILMRLSYATSSVYTNNTVRGRVFVNGSEFINEWYHFAHERVGSTNTVYINGVSRLTWEDATSYNQASQNDLWLFSRYASTNEDFDGYVSDFRCQTGSAKYGAPFTPDPAMMPFGIDDPNRDNVVFHLRGDGKWSTITPGSGYANGFHSVAFTGGTGSGASGQVLVKNNQVVEAYIEDAGSYYTAGDLLSGTVPAAPNPQLGEILTLQAPVGGSGYADATYPGVALTGGNGSSATADITVSGGAVTGVVLVSGGTGYLAGDQLSAADADLGNLGTGAGFTVDVATIDDAATLSTTPWSAEVLYIERAVPAWALDANSGNDRLGEYGTSTNRWAWAVHHSRHYKYPWLMIAFLGNSATDGRWFTADYNAKTASEGITTNITSPPREQWGALGENFGIDGEDQSTVQTIRWDSGANPPEIHREMVHCDFVSWHPQGTPGWSRTMGAYEWAGSGYGYIHSMYGSHRPYADSQGGRAPWVCPHGLVSLPHATDPARNVYAHCSRADWQTGYYRVKGYDPRFIPYQDPATGEGMVSVGATGTPTRDQLGKAQAQPFSNISYQTGNYSIGWDYNSPHKSVGAAYANQWDATSCGRIIVNGQEKYKGMITNGQDVWFQGNQFVSRTVAPGTETVNKYDLGSWPLDPINDAEIFNPLRWDVFGWNGTAWIKEEWSYDYDTATWSVDPATVHPGRPAPAGGGTQNLDGISEYPYSGLNVSFSDLLPEATVNPLFGEWSSQFIYNGLILDGTNEFAFTNSISNLPMIQGTITQTIPAGGVIQVSESFNQRFQMLATQFDSLFDLEIDGVDAPCTIGEGRDGPAAAGEITRTSHQLIFHPDDVGKTVSGTYHFTQYTTQDDPANWARFRIDKEDIVQSSSNDLLGGSSYQLSANLVAAGWTEETTPGDAYFLASWYPNEVPDGFPAPNHSSAYQVGTDEVYFAPMLVFLNDTVGWHWCKDTDSLQARNYANRFETAGAPSYGSVGFAYDTGLALQNVHSRVYTDGALEDWLIFRAQWSIGAEYAVLEVWIKVSDPWTYEARLGDFGGLTWAPLKSANSYVYHGVVTRPGTAGQTGSRLPSISPGGTRLISNFFRNTGGDTNGEIIQLFKHANHFGDRFEEWAGTRFMFDFDQLGVFEP